MKDNVSIIIAAIISVILVVIVPIFSVLQKQDDISYNVVLTLTTKFVDEVKHKGFITKKMYDEYANKITATGNIYNIKFEAHRKILVKVKDDEYKEKTIIDDYKDIYNDLKDAAKGNCYTFDIADEFYVKLYNTNVPNSSLIYNYLFGSVDSKIIDINYGGIISGFNAKEYNTSVTSEIYPEIIIGLPKNDARTTPKTPVEVVQGYGASYAYDYFFDLKEADNKTLTFDVILKNFTTDSLDSTKLKDYIALNDFNADIQTDITSQDTTNGRYSYNAKITLTNMRIDNGSTRASITIMENLDGNSSPQDSVEFLLYANYDIYTLNISGPYIANTGELTPKVYLNEEVYFNIDFTSIDTNAADIQEAFENNCIIWMDGENKEITSDYIEDISYTVKYDSNICAGRIEVRFNYKESYAEFISELDEGYYLKLKDNWIQDVVDYNGDLIIPTGGESNIYSLGEDNTSPSGNVKIIDGAGKDVELVESNQYISPTSKVTMQINKNNIKETQSGVYSLSYKFNNSDTFTTKTFGKSNIINVTLELENVKKVWYYFTDNVGNKMEPEQIIVATQAVPYKFYATSKENEPSSAEIPQKTWVNKLYLNAIIDDDYTISSKIDIYNNNTMITTANTSIKNYQITQSGKYELYAEANNGFKKVRKPDGSGYYEYWLDNKKPDITYSRNNSSDSVYANGTVWYKSVEFKNINVTDTGDSGIDRATVEIDSDTPISIDTPISCNSGKHILKFFVKDKAENSVSKIEEVNVDSEGPDITNSTSTDLSQAYIHIYDQYTGLNQAWYTFGQTNLSSQEIQKLDMTKLTISSGGVNQYINFAADAPYMYIMAKDYIGNISTKVIENPSTHYPVIEVENCYWGTRDINNEVTAKKYAAIQYKIYNVNKYMIKEIMCNSLPVAKDEIIFSDSENTATFVIRVPSTRTVIITLLTNNNYTTSLTHNVNVQPLNYAMIYNINGNNVTITNNTYQAKTVTSLSFIESENVESVSKNDNGIQITYSEGSTNQYYLFKQVVNRNFWGIPTTYIQELINITSVDVEKGTGVIVLKFNTGMDFNKSTINDYQERYIYLSTTKSPSNPTIGAIQILRP